MTPNRENATGNIQNPKMTNTFQMHKHTYANANETNKKNAMHMPLQFHKIQLRLDGQNEVIKTAICFSCFKPWTQHGQEQKHKAYGAFDAVNYQCLIYM